MLNQELARIAWCIYPLSDKNIKDVRKWFKIVFFIICLLKITIYFYDRVLNNWPVGHRCFNLLLVVPPYLPTNVCSVSVNEISNSYHGISTIALRVLLGIGVFV